jgi:enterobactin synthetase component D
MSDDHGLAAELSQKSGAFLTDIVFRPFARADMLMLQCRYHVDRFKDDLFMHLGVYFPDRLRSAVESRRAEYLAGRVLAKATLSCLGMTEVNVSSGNDRAPIWPIGAIGTISHSHGRCAVLASTDQNVRVGIDVERLAEGDARAAILNTCVSKEERRLINGQKAYSLSQVVTLVFSAKETLYKMLYPMVRAYFGFEAATIREEPTGTSLGLYLTQDLQGGLRSGSAFDIQFEFGADYVLTWASVDR